VAEADRWYVFRATDSEAIRMFGQLWPSAAQIRHDDRLAVRACRSRDIDRVRSERCA